MFGKNTIFIKNAPFNYYYIILCKASQQYIHKYTEQNTKVLHYHHECKGALPASNLRSFASLRTASNWIQGSTGGCGVIAADWIVMLRTLL